MIKGIMGTRSVVVNGGDTALPYVPMNASNPIQGMIRVHGTDMQVFDGSTWMNLQTSYATVELTPEVESLLQWAREKRNEEFELKALAQSHPAVANAIEAIKKAEKQLDLVVKLSKEHGETVETSQF